MLSDINFNPKCKLINMGHLNLHMSKRMDKVMFLTSLDLSGRIKRNREEYIIA
ncbi:ZYRO0F04620p [Zygosaccharomyces rouxii]|uniref:ZYRO0F04620p n=1 Tax=Zygosaccharomyces rouxii (strain ATCC 2623 / CBS 732 / NBRC 1130 / NCYC 568 / NRRL Y-229) TaxID=559307 RepID=C5DXF4_ZYGRC|nr:uncharacterized protein ZYRO0F04620g [Zygosaccharomyces rouxii]CAR28465.1 ZYRO0F04620p [Zygosaccharomyces rouxii]